MKTRVLVGVVCVPIVIAILFFAPAWATGLFVGAVCVFCAWEFMRSSGYKRTAGFYAWTVAAILLSVLVCYGTYGNWSGAPQYIIILMYAAFAVAFIVFLINIGKAHSKGVQATVPVSSFLICGGIGIPLYLATLISLRLVNVGVSVEGAALPEIGKYLVLVPVISAFVTDAGAYFIGVTLGKRRPFPNVSPKKSVEGFIGGLVIGTAAVIGYGFLVRYLGYEVNFLYLALCGFGGAVATELGDLAFSLIKRDRGIKDFGNLLPGHGGVLDRFDSMVLCAPVIWAINWALPIIG